MKYVLIYLEENALSKAERGNVMGNPQLATAQLRAAISRNRPLPQSRPQLVFGYATANRW